MKCTIGQYYVEKKAYLISMARRRLVDSGQAEDVIQDVFCELWNELKERSISEKKLHSFMVQRAVDRCKNCNKKKKPRLVGIGINGIGNEGGLCDSPFPHPWTGLCAAQKEALGKMMGEE